MFWSKKSSPKSESYQMEEVEEEVIASYPGEVLFRVEEGDEAYHLTARLPGGEPFYCSKELDERTVTRFHEKVQGQFLV